MSGWLVTTTSTKPSVREGRAGLDHAGQQPQLRQPSAAGRHAVAHERLVEHPVAVEEDRRG